jgi:hypothetical protein
MKASRSRPSIAAELKVLRPRPCSRCQSLTSSEELISFGARALCLYCVEVWNDDLRLHTQNAQLREEAWLVSSELARVVRQIAQLLDGLGRL